MAETFNVGIHCPNPLCASTVNSACHHCDFKCAPVSPLDLVVKSNLPHFSTFEALRYSYPLLFKIFIIHNLYGPVILLLRILLKYLKQLSVVNCLCKKALTYMLKGCVRCIFTIFVLYV